MHKFGMAIVFLGLTFAGSALADPRDCSSDCTDPSHESEKAAPIDRAGKSSFRSGQNIRNCTDECGVVTCSDDQCSLFVFGNGKMEHIGEGLSEAEARALYRLYQAESILDGVER